MSPVTIAARWKALETFDQKHACITDLSASRCLQLETLDEVCLVFLGVGESGARNQGMLDKELIERQTIKLTLTILLYKCNNLRYSDKPSAYERKT